MPCERKEWPLLKPTPMVSTSLFLPPGRRNRNDNWLPTLEQNYPQAFVWSTRGVTALCSATRPKTTHSSPPLVSLSSMESLCVQVDQNHSANAPCGRLD